MEEGQRMPQAVVVALGVTGAACWACVLVPQALLNARRRSTEGMSLGLIILWHLAVLVSCGYYAAGFLPSDDGGGGGGGGMVWAVLSMSLCGIVCGFIEAQTLAYRPRADGVAPGRSPRFVLIVGSTLFTAVFLALCAFLMWVFSRLPEAASYALGNAVSSALLALGFIPQLWEFWKNRSIQGYSFGVTAIDMLGCSANTIVLFAPANIGVDQAVKEAMPFIIVIVMHFVLIAVALWVVLIGSRRSASSSTGKLARDGASKDVVSELPAVVADDSGNPCVAAPAVV